LEEIITISIGRKEPNELKLLKKIKLRSTTIQSIVD